MAAKVLGDVREYAEGLPVAISCADNGRLVVVARNQAGFDGVEIDLLDLLESLVNEGFASEGHSQAHALHPIYGNWR